MAGTYSNLLYHLVFSTKNREPQITAELQPKLYAYIGGIVRGERGALLQIGGMPDHVHLLVKFRTDEAIADLLKKVKRNSSVWVHQNFPRLRAFKWQDGYGTFTVSESMKERTKKYIAGQAEHHRKKSFQGELVEFLKANNVEFDPKLLWK